MLFHVQMDEELVGCIEHQHRVLFVLIRINKDIFLVRHHLRLYPGLSLQQRSYCLVNKVCLAYLIEARNKYKVVSRCHASVGFAVELSHDVFIEKVVCQWL